ncbi:hypothetical protein EXW60_09875 [Bacillus mycoides]|nr:hypothetical protein EXW60_09875 [Bacillus mycoides]QWG92476.1 hypothetical protein EXW40_26330 [Bacillus mycoides]
MQLPVFVFLKIKSASGSFRIAGHWSSRPRSAFCFDRESEMAGDSCRWSWIYLKAQAARSESRSLQALDQEALFASTERAKWPEILAAGAGYT